MNATEWAKSYQLKNEHNQKQMERAVETLSKGKLNGKNEGVQEAAAKLFCEGIVFLEGTLLYQREIHPHDLDPVKISMNRNEYVEKHKEVERIIGVEIRRQLRLMTTIL